MLSMTSVKRKFILGIIVFCSNGLFSKLNAQESALEQSIFGIETGILGLWAYNETRISDQVVLRSEVGLSSKIVLRMVDETNWLCSLFFTCYRFELIFVPVLSVEPRFYYNIDKRREQNKKTIGNSANFIAFKARYYPNFFTISNFPIETVSSFTTTTSWGLRRAIGISKFHYETALGFSYNYYLSNSQSINHQKNYFLPYFNFRLGYRF